MNDTVSSVVALDIGNSKVSVLIAHVHATNQLEVIGMATANNRGMSKGKIIDLNQVSSAIKQAVQEAETSASCRIHSAWVSIPSAELYSEYNTGSARVHTQDNIISEHEINKALEVAKSRCQRADYHIVNAIPMGFELDGNEDWIQSPIGMTAQQLTGHYRFIMMPNTVMQNIRQAMKNANIHVDNIVVSTLATAESTLLEDEKEYGVCLVSIGSSTTSIAVYLEGRLLLIHTLPIGGDQVTRDIATVLKTTTEEAEKLKIQYGSLDFDSFKPEQMVQIHMIDGTKTISRADLVEIIMARYREILQQVKAYLQQEQVLGVLQHGIVLSGEASSIDGMVAFTRKSLGVSVHLANPHSAIRGTDSTQTAILGQARYATANGVLLFSQNDTTSMMANDEPYNPSLWQRLALMWRNFVALFKKHM